MNGYWLRITCLSLLVGACGSGKFSEDFASEIQRDCIETLACTQEGQIEGCIVVTANNLDTASTSQQQYFVDAVYRCQGAANCAYVNCTQSTTDTGYAATHVPQITYDCQQKIACRSSSGQMPAASAVQQCIQETSNRLNANPTEQASYDARFTRCQSYAGCSFGACQ